MNLYYIRARHLFVITIILFAVSCAKPPAKESVDKGLDNFKVVGYISAGSLDVIDQIDLSAITHLNIAFANPDQAGKLVFRAEDQLEYVVDKAHKKGVKVYISLAGGSTSNELPERWLQVLKSGQRAHFVEQIEAFVIKHQLDGVDVDLEWNVMPTIDSLYTPFVLALKNVLKKHQKGITTALNVSHLHQGITQESLLAYDFINIMVYDKTGPWLPEKPGQHSPYAYALEALDYWTKERKIPSNKLILGVPFYGHDFKNIGSVSYRELLAQDTANAWRDEVGKIYYNGIPTMIKKTELALDSFGGIMIWQLAQDTIGQYSLLHTIDQTIKKRKLAKVD